MAAETDHQAGRPCREPLVVASNRGPVSLHRRASGTAAVRHSAGGLVATLGPGARRSGALWLSCSGDGDAAPAGRVDSDGLRVQPVPVDPATYAAHYEVISNGTLWFLLHGLWDPARTAALDASWRAAWAAFGAVNRRVAAAVSAAAAEGATVLVHDYQLALVPRLLAEQRPDLRIACFLHTPWCTPGELAALPDEAAAELLAGIAGGTTCGFHAARWADSFRACCAERLGQVPATFVAPAGADVAGVRALAGSAGCDRELERLDRLVGSRRLICRVDRIDPSKNVLRGFAAYDRLLEDRPDLRGDVVFAAMVYPSRTTLRDYVAHGREVRAAAAAVNHRWGRPGWTPILLDTDDHHARSIAALRRADVLLVNPVRDGLNLVAKEGPLVNERDGVLVLSRAAGAWDELACGAVGIDPLDVPGTAAALARAVDLPAGERARRAAALRHAAAARTPEGWFADLCAAAQGG